MRYVLDDSVTDINDVVDPVVRGRKDVDMVSFKKIVWQLVSGIPLSETQSVHA